MKPNNNRFPKFIRLSTQLSGVIPSQNEFALHHVSICVYWIFHGDMNISCKSKTICELPTLYQFQPPSSNSPPPLHSPPRACTFTGLSHSRTGIQPPFRAITTACTIVICSMFCRCHVRVLEQERLYRLPSSLLWLSQAMCCLLWCDMRPTVSGFASFFWNQITGRPATSHDPRLFIFSVALVHSNSTRQGINVRPRNVTSELLSSKRCRLCNLPRFKITIPSTAPWRRLGEQTEQALWLRESLTKTKDPSILDHPEPLARKPW